MKNSILPNGSYHSERHSRCVTLLEPSEWRTSIYSQYLHHTKLPDVSLCTHELLGVSDVLGLLVSYSWSLQNLSVKQFCYSTCQKKDHSKSLCPQETALRSLERLSTDHIIYTPIYSLCFLIMSCNK